MRLVPGVPQHGPQLPRPTTAQPWGGTRDINRRPVGRNFVCRKGASRRRSVGCQRHERAGWGRTHQRRLDTRTFCPRGGGRFRARCAVLAARLPPCSLNSPACELDMSSGKRATWAIGLWDEMRVCRARRNDENGTVLNLGDDTSKESAFPIGPMKEGTGTGTNERCIGQLSHLAAAFVACGQCGSALWAPYGG